MPFREDLKPDRLLALEEEVLALWDRERTFEATLERRRGGAPWVFYEGPPTANGKPGIHHVLARAVKDFACRWKTMQGRYVARKAGWDTHGLPVEIETEKRLGLSGKKGIEEMGIAAFNAACRESVFRYIADWNHLTRRMGYWVDLERPYVTCDPAYVETLWWILAQLHRRGLLYRGYKVLPYCPRCSTPLSSHEVGLGFEDVQDPSVFVRFAREDGQGSLLVWTTTPWTLPANVAVAAGPDVEYVEVEVAEGPEAGERLWLAAARLEVLKVRHAVRRTVRGRDLVGVRYRRLLPWYPVEVAAKAFTVLPADFVSTEDGTGFVHIAPAYGQDDFELGRREGLPVLHPVDGAGRFRPGSPVEGQGAKEADREILRLLKAQGSLFRRETIVHAYPHCWRCQSPLLYYARDSWYLRTTQFKDAMLRENASIEWHPASTGTGRFGEWLANNVDWAVSRDRYWGTPLPVWVCDGCRREHAVESYAELERLSGVRLGDPHRPFVDEPSWACGATGCAGTMRRTPEVADAWFDSGAMPFGQWHYPFEHREEAERHHPAAFISEAVDQTRGWFYTLLAVSVMLTGRTSYRSCASLGHILDAHGKKMSKSRGNVVDPLAVIGRYGADVVRWHLLVRPLGVPLRYDEKDLVEIRNRFFGTLLNVYAFFATYANADGLARPAAVPPARRPVFDRWLVSRLHRLLGAVAQDLEGFDTAHAGQRIVEFVVEDLSNWYVRRNRRRFYAPGVDDDKASAYATLHGALLAATHLAAPFAPFVTEALHRELARGLPDAPSSVHMADWPTADPSLVDASLEAGMEAVRRVVSLGHAARDRAGLKVKQPLARAQVWGLSPPEREFVRTNADIVRDELNVKAIDFLVDFPPGVQVKASLNKKEAARRLGSKTPHVEAVLAQLSAQQVLERLQHPDSSIPTPEGLATLGPGDVRVVVEATQGSTAEMGGAVLVVLDTTLTPDLVAEGIAREVVRRLNDLRKKAGLNVEDRVAVRWWAGPEAAPAMRAHRDWVAAEVLAAAFEEAPDGAGLEPLEVPGHDVRVSLRRA